MSGFFKISRVIFDSDIWHSPSELRLFVYLIGKARYQEEPIEVRGVTVKKGQYLRSLRKLQKDLEYKENRAVKQYPRTTLMRMIQSLIDSDRITVETTQQGTLFTVVNYCKYQDRYEPDKPKEDKVLEVTRIERQILDILKSIPKWGYDEEKDLAKVRELAGEFPRVDMLTAVKEMREWLEGKPLKKSSNPRLRLRRWITNADKFGTHKESKVVDTTNWLRR